MVDGLSVNSFLPETAMLLGGEDRTTLRFARNASMWKRRREWRGSESPTRSGGEAVGGAISSALRSLAPIRRHHIPVVFSEAKPMARATLQLIDFAFCPTT